MICGGHVCALYVVTAGQQGATLGSDEEEIVLLIYVVIDVVANKIIGLQQYPVRPTRVLMTQQQAAAVAAAGGVPDGALPVTVTAGVPAPAAPPLSAAPAPVALTREVLDTTALTDDIVNATGLPLDVVIEQFDKYVRSLQLDPNSPLFRLVTDGQPPLRQCVHPEACSKYFELPPYYARFHDLRKEFARSYTHRSMDPAAAAQANPAQAQITPIDASNSIPDMLNYLGIPSYTGNEFYVRAAKDMANIIQRIIADGFRLELPETIDLVLETGICSKDDDIDGNCIVRARGLPWQSSDQDIAKFFRGLNVAKGGVALCLSSQGRRNGEALIRFVSMEHRDMALKRHRHHLNKRYIEVYRATGDEFLAVAGGATTEATAFLSRGAQVIIRMRGLPYDCTAQQVLDFFSSGNDPCNVLDGTEGVLFVHRFDGRATGDAFVLFAAEDDAPRALGRHRNLIGSRYIELFRSTIAEVQQVLNRALEPKPAPPPPAPTTVVGSAPAPDGTLGFGLGLGAVPLLPQHVITSGTLKDCVRLRGLPYEAQVEHILKFLDDFAKNIAYQGVHMVYNAQGQPSGEAFIQMDSEASAFLCAQQKHHRYMTFCKKQRYIEVFQCSGEDMNLVLTGGISSPVSPVSAGKVLPSPPGITFGGSFGVRYAGPAPAPLPPSAAPTAPLLYWGYPSPPVSPSHYFHPHAALHQPHHTLMPEVVPLNGTSPLPGPYDHQPLPLIQGGIPGLSAGPPAPAHLTPLNLNPLTMELYMVN